MRMAIGRAKYKSTDYEMWRDRTHYFVFLLCKKHGMTNDELAMHLGVCNTTIKHWSNRGELLGKYLNHRGNYRDETSNIKRSD